MNVLDIDRQTFEGSCYRASQSLMWNARQQTDPEKMLRFALAAQYAEGYVERVIDIHRNKALASFELGLMNSERFELSGIPDNDALTPDLISRLTAFIEDSAKLHAGRDLDEGRIDHESPNFGAMAVSCAENTAGIDDFDAGKRVGELLASRDKGAAGNEAHDVLTVKYEASYGGRSSLDVAAYDAADRATTGGLVRDWYMRAYPDDELGGQVAPSLTFSDALRAVPRSGDFYEVLGVGDSIMRERVFEELATRTGLPYDDIYERWLNHTP